MAVRRRKALFSASGLVKMSQCACFAYAPKRMGALLDACRAAYYYSAVPGTTITGSLVCPEIAPSIYQECYTPARAARDRAASMVASG